MSDADRPEFDRFVGRWQGTWRTWIEPDVLHSEAATECTFRTILGGRDLVQEYHGEIGGEAVEGFALIANSQLGITVCWVDSWHTSGLVMVSVGEATDDGFAVSTTYDAEGATWTWSSEFTATGDRVIIRHFNEGPALPKYLGVEAILERER